MKHLLAQRKTDFPCIRTSLPGLGKLFRERCYEVQQRNYFEPLGQSWVPNWLLKQLGVDFFHRVVAVNMVYKDNGNGRTENDQLTDAALACQDGLPKLRALALKGTQVTDEGLQQVARLTQLEELYIWDGTQVTDAGAMQLAALKRLRSLHLSNSKIGDESLHAFGTLPSLEDLSLQGNSFSNQGLAHLGRMTQLRSLWIGLGDHTITDGGMTELKQLTNLEQLDLQNANISDIGLNHLTELVKLRRLLIRGTRVANRDALHAALPNCRIDY